MIRYAEIYHHSLLQDTQILILERFLTLIFFTQIKMFIYKVLVQLLTKVKNQNVLIVTFKKDLVRIKTLKFVPKRLGNYFLKNMGLIMRLEGIIRKINGPIVQLWR